MSRRIMGLVWIIGFVWIFVIVGGLVGAVILARYGLAQ